MNDNLKRYKASEPCEGVPMPLAVAILRFWLTCLTKFFCLKIVCRDVMFTIQISKQSVAIALPLYRMGGTWPLTGHRFGKELTMNFKFLEVCIRFMGGLP